MQRFLTISAALGLATLGGCSDPDDGFSLDGEWGWFGAESCEGRANVIAFKDDAIDVYMDGRHQLHVEDATIGRTADALTVSYIIQTSRLTETYAIDGPDIITLTGSTIDGAPRTDARDIIGRRLVRCSASG